LQLSALRGAALDAEAEGGAGMGHPVGEHNGQELQLWNHTTSAASSGSHTYKLVDLGKIIPLSLGFPVCDIGITLLNQCNTIMHIKGLALCLIHSVQ